jgi:acetyltransferase
LIITNGGGMGVLATDESEAQKLYLLDDPNLMSRLFEDIIPQFGSLKNPIDLTGMATPKTYKQALTAALTSERIDSIIVLYTMGAQQVPQEFAEAIITAIKDAPAKPLMVAMFGGVETKEAIKILNRAKTPAYEDPEAAVRALGAIYRWKSYLRRPPTSDPEELEADWDKIKKIIAHVHTQGRLQLLEHEVKEILKAIGLEVPPYRVAHSIEECIEAADELGYPVVLKIISEDIIHKTEAGGIKLNLQNSGEVKSAYKAILASCRKAYPQAHIRGILVTPMIFGGVEVIIGVSHDPSFGPTLMFGLGGIYVEVLRDVSFRVAPITKSEAHQMISEIRSASILRGVRGELPKDIAALAEAIYRVGKMVDRMREIIELDINPMKVLDDGMGCIVLDGRMTISEVK